MKQRQPLKIRAAAPPLLLTWSFTVVWVSACAIAGWLVSRRRSSVTIRLLLLLLLLLLELMGLIIAAGVVVAVVVRRLMISIWLNLRRVLIIKVLLGVMMMPLGSVGSWRAAVTQDQEGRFQDVQTSEEVVSI